MNRTAIALLLIASPALADDAETFCRSAYDNVLSGKLGGVSNQMLTACAVESRLTKAEFGSPAQATCSRALVALALRYPTNFVPRPATWQLEPMPAVFACNSEK